MKVGINGFGRIGRMTSRRLLEDPEVELVGINDPADLRTLAHLFKYDSVHGPLQKDVDVDEGKGIRVDQNSFIPFSQEKEPDRIPWREFGAEIVIEASGLFRSKKAASLHLAAGAEKVIISAPSSDKEVKTIVLGVNDDILMEEDKVISNASCTTNSAAPMIAVLDELCGIESCYITTVHSYTMDQRLHDAPHKDLRRARAAAESIVPTTTGAAKAITRIFPHLDLKMGGCGIRVPVPDGSLTDITCVVDQEISMEKVNQAFHEASQKELSGYLQYITDPVVSRDIIGNPYSCIFDSQLTSVIGRMVKIVGWYDNEIGYSNRLLDLVKKVG